MTPASPKFSDAAVGAFIPGPRLILQPTARGPLDGITFAVKDLIDVAGAPTGGGNPDWLASQKPATVSAPVVEVLLNAGATMVGKTITDELAFSLEGVNAHYGTPLNPAAPDRIPGGSSSGSAAAVAAGLVDFALGTDTGGSVRVPASFVGVFGLRPTHDAVSLEGVVPFAPSYDTVGWFARDARTLAAVGNVLLPNNTHATPIQKFILVRDAFALADPAVADALKQTCARLPIDDEIVLFDGAENDWLECYRVLQGAEIWQNLGHWIESTQPHFGPAIAPRLADAATITPADVARWTPFRASVAERLHHLLNDGVALIVPTAPCSALRKDADAAEIGAFYRRALVLTSIAGHAGLPQLTLPVSAVDGCPVGLSVIGASGQDRALLSAAAHGILNVDTNEAR